MVDGGPHAAHIRLFTVHVHLAGDLLAVGVAEEAHSQLRAPRAHQARKAHDLSRPDADVDVFQHLPVPVVGVEHVPVFHLEDGLADLAVLPLGVAVGQLPAHHALDDAVLAELVHALVEGLDGVAVPDDGDGVGHVADLVELMGNNDTGHALGLQLQHQLQQLGALGVVEGGGGFVQDQQVRLLAHGLGDLNHLLLAHAQGIDRDIHIQIAHTHPLQQCLGFLAGTGPVDDALVLALVAQEHVLRHRQIGAQRQLLVDDDDALVFALLNAVELAGLAAVDDVPLVCAVGIHAAQHVHQGGLSGPVLTADGHDLAALDLEVYVVQGFHAGEGLDDVVHFQDILLCHFFTPSFLFTCWVYKSGRRRRPPSASGTISGSGRGLISRPAGRRCSSRLPR